MRAAVCRQYGPPDVVRIEDIPKPAPGEGEVVVRVVAATLCTADWRLRRSNPAPMSRLINGSAQSTKINVLGMELAGTVDAVGKGAGAFKLGERVFGASSAFGAHAEYVCVPERALARVPDRVSFHDAAALPYGGVLALHLLKLAGIAAGQKILIRGASGCVGSAAVQLAKHFGAIVTGVCRTPSVDLVRSIGADGVIDFAHDDSASAGRVYDIVHDAIGGFGYRRARRVLKRGGVFIDEGPGLASSLVGPWLRWIGTGDAVGTVAKGGREALDFLASLVAEGKFKPVIDGRYALADIVRAHRHAEDGPEKGNLVIDVALVPVSGRGAR